MTDWGLSRVLYKDSVSLVAQHFDKDTLVQKPTLTIWKSTLFDFEWADQISGRSIYINRSRKQLLMSTGFLIAG